MAAITSKDELNPKIRDLEKTDPARDNADVVQLLIDFRNCVEELQTEVVALGGTIALTVASTIDQILKK